MNCWLCERPMGIALTAYSTEDQRRFFYCAWCNYLERTVRP